MFVTQPRWKSLCCALAGGLLLTLTAVRADPLPLDRNRDTFRAAAAALTGNPAAYEAERKQLDNYLLAPYLDYARLNRDLATVSAATAQQFLAAEASTQLGRQFRRDYLAELARRADWPAFLAFDTGNLPLSTELRCQRVQALLAADRTGDARRELLELWPTGQSLPTVCDGPLAVARDRGWLDSTRVWQRLRLAADAGNAGLAGVLARLLPADETVAGERLAGAVADPEATLKSAAQWLDAPGQREAVVRALQRRARATIDSAIDHWSLLSSRFAFSTAERSAVLHELALYAAVAYRPDAEDWFERVPMEARSEQLAEWQLRAALARQDWPAVLKVVDGLPPALAAAPRSRYWRGRALGATRRPGEARDVYATLATETNFHGFLAADRLDAPYVICPREIEPDPARAAALRGQRDVARALELQAVGWLPEAARAWDFARQGLGEADRRQLLLLASSQGWHDRVVFALSSGDDQRFYSLRFPLAERATVQRETARNALDPAWTYALIRAESAWQPDVRSPANAYGLMQLLPATGQRMARQLGMSWLGPGTLLDPEANISLGTRYLAQQAERFQGSPWLATAAYNAGPAPVLRWVDERGTLPADVFIETIPYRETRDYVTRVLAFSVIYDWRLNGAARPLSARLPDPGRPLAPAAVTLARRTVSCGNP
ncbi:MAG: transglycosylase SLT domain-containing protein [Gammaproteobacteria bacterium]